MIHTQRVLTVCLTVVTLLLVNDWARAGYVYSLLAARGDTIGGKLLNSTEDPKINDAGIVVFNAFINNATGGGSGVFTPTSKIAARGDVIDGQTLNYTNSPMINNAGQIMFHSSISAGGSSNGIFSPADSVIRTGDVIDGRTVSYIDTHPALSDSGEVVFRAQATGGYGIFTQNRTIVREGDTVGGVTLSSVDNPAINSSGLVAFRGFQGSNGGIFTASGVVAKKNDVIGGKTLTAFEHPSMNDAGDIVWRSATTTGGGYFKQNEAVAHTGDVIDGLTLGTVMTGTPSINEFGEASFWSWYDGSHDGIFTQHGVVARKGDVLDGKTILGFGYDTSINNSGQVVFQGIFAGGPGIFLATPTPGTNEQNPVMPSGGGASGWQFDAVPGDGQWFDPVAADGYEYQTDGTSNFTNVGMPVGVPDDDGMYVVTSIHGSVDVPVGGFLQFAAPVDFFTVTGIDPAVDGEHPSAFPTFLEFDQSSVSFTMTPVPEPSAFVLAALGLIGLAMFVPRRER